MKVRRHTGGFDLRGWLTRWSALLRRRPPDDWLARIDRASGEPGQTDGAGVRHHPDRGGSAIDTAPAGPVPHGPQPARVARFRPSPRTWLWVGSFAVPLVAGYLFAALVLFPAPFFTATRPVPNLLDRPLDEAGRALESAGLIARDTVQETHPTVATGHVIWQDPPAGVRVPEGTSVHLVISRGSPRIPVPDVSGYDAQLARLLVEAAGLRVGRVESVQTAAPRNVTVNTRPPPGSTVRAGGAVTLVVSLGAPTIQVPDLAGLTLEEATDTLAAAGLSLGTWFRQSTNQQVEGLIFRQEPAAGTLIAPGSAINVRIARRPR